MPVFNSDIEAAVYRELRFGDNAEILRMVDEVINTWLQRASGAELGGCKREGVRITCGLRCIKRCNYMSFIGE